MLQAWERELNNRKKYPNLSSEIMQNEYGLLWQMIRSLVYIPLVSDEKREFCRDLIVEELNKKKSKSKSWSDVQKYVYDYLFGLYINNTGRFNYKYWAKSDSSCAEPYVTTSASESINKKIRSLMPKAAIFENQIRAIKKCYKDTWQNFIWQSNHDNLTKRKKRKAIIRNVMLSAVYNQMKSLRFINQATFAPDDDATYMFECLFHFLPRIEKHAAKIVEGKDELFQTWLRYHTFHFPEDKMILSPLFDNEARLPIDPEKVTISEMIIKVVPKKKKSTKRAATPSEKKKQPTKKRSKKIQPIQDIYQINSTLIGNDISADSTLEVNIDLF